MSVEKLVAGLAFALVVGGCGGSDDSGEPRASGGSGGTGGTPSSGGTAGGGAGGQTQKNPDFESFESILDGKTDAKTGLSEIARSDGLPIQHADGFVFVRLDDGKGPYSLAGDFSNWEPVPMKAEAGLFWIIHPVASPDGAKYKFVGVAESFAADPLARRYGYDEFGEFSLVRASAPHLERWLDLTDGTLAPRELRIWRSSETTTHHLYVHDGQNLFDPMGAFGSWKLDDSVGPKTLVIGIDNAGAARMDEYTHVPDSINGSTIGGKGDQYASFVKDVVRPLVEARYGKPLRAGVMGSSLGGLISFHQALKNSEIWDFAASLSGTFGWGSIGAENETLIRRFENTPKLSTKLYLDSGGGPGSGCVDSDADGTNDDTADSADNYCETVQLRDLLETKGYAFDVDLWHWWEQGATHDEGAWAARVFRPVQIFEGL